MKTYQLRNELSKHDQQKHVYVQLPDGTLFLISDKSVIEKNGIVIIKSTN